MNTLKKLSLSAIAILSITCAAQARDQIKMVGSSTVYPFASYVAEELGATTKYKTPVVESTGSGGGAKLFCSGASMDTPDITNASRFMKVKEFELCQKNGVTDITAVMIGYDGIAIAQSNENKELDLSKEQLFLAVAAKIVKDGKLIDNPYKKWSDIDKNLPDRQIIVYGPPTSSGTRDAFEELVMQKVTKTNQTYKENALAHGAKKFKGYDVIRQDGVYVPSGENDNLIVQKLEKNKDAIGIFGYSFLAENADKIAPAHIDGKTPTPSSIADGSYPISRSLYFYIKNSHVSKVPAMKAYIDLFMSEKMIGSQGILKTIGLIPLDDNLRAKVQNSVKNGTKLTLDMVKKRSVLQ